jgi:ribosomal-protein-serine acetyltransferase
MNLIEFEGIQLKTVQMTDAAAIFNIIDNNRKHLREWLPFIDFTIVQKDTEEFIKAIIPQENINPVYVIIVNEETVGLIGYKGTDTANKKTEIGYWLAEKHQGNGIVTKACKTLINNAFSYMGINRIQIRAGVNNNKSCAIPKRLGFKFEGIERAGEFLNGVFIDLNVYSILKEEWK